MAPSTASRLHVLQGRLVDAASSAPLAGLEVEALPAEDPPARPLASAGDALPAEFALGVLLYVYSQAALRYAVNGDAIVPVVAGDGPSIGDGFGPIPKRLAVDRGRFFDTGDRGCGAALARRRRP
jgi:hypothetical protein